MLPANEVIGRLRIVIDRVGVDHLVGRAESARSVLEGLLPDDLALADHLVAVAESGVVQALRSATADERSDPDVLTRLAGRLAAAGMPSGSATTAIGFWNAALHPAPERQGSASMRGTAPSPASAPAFTGPPVATVRAGPEELSSASAGPSPARRTAALGAAVAIAFLSSVALAIATVLR